MESTELVADFVTTAGAMGTDDEDDKTISQKDDKTHNVPSVHFILLYLALSCKAPILWRIFATANGKRKTIHPLRFARRPCLRGTVSYNRLVATPITSNP